MYKKLEYIKMIDAYTVHWNITYVKCKLKNTMNKNVSVI